MILLFLSNPGTGLSLTPVSPGLLTLTAGTVGSFSLTATSPGSVGLAVRPAWSLYPDSPVAYPDYAFPGDPGLDPFTPKTPGTLTLTPN